MKKDILYLPVEQVAMAIVPSEGNELMASLFNQQE